MSGPAVSPPPASKYALAALVALPLVLCDQWSKHAVLRSLGSMYASRDVLGEYLRFHLLMNRGAAFSIGVGDHGRWVMLLLSSAVLAYVVWLLVRTDAAQRLRTVALAMIISGAIGNALDRLTSDRGVIDFIDVGVGRLRFYVFNVADACITVGVALLMIAYRFSRTRPAA